MTVTANSQLLAGRVILITGAASGIGAAVAQCCAAQGATAILLDKNLPALEKVYDSIIEQGHATPAIYPLDLKGASQDDYLTLANSIEQNFSRLDGLIHCAASLGQLAPTPHQNSKLWAEILHINLSAPVMLTRACLSSLESTGDSFIIFTTDSVQAKAYWGAYGIAKAGIECFANQLADEQASSGRIKICSFDPGRVNTEFLKRAYPALNPSDLPKAEDIAPDYLEIIHASVAAVHGKQLQHSVKQSSLAFD
ncbi:MAG: SDR family NAD(P)-dependent oxidoreductase [Methylophaga sp.]|nr:SDR family NAD(P)-dependent oxidoreductase [Methylophaga sp.]